MPGDISPHFTSGEAKCKCGCGQKIINPYLIGIIENIRGHFSKPMMIYSWNRCKARNKAVGGSPKSQHLLGHAVDFSIPGISLKEVYDYCDKVLKVNGLGYYSKKGFIHIDCRENKARWEDLAD